MARHSGSNQDAVDDPDSALEDELPEKPRDDRCHRPRHEHSDSEKARAAKSAVEEERRGQTEGHREGRRSNCVGHRSRDRRQEVRVGEGTLIVA